ncbi:MAG TPA: T9SS type A sorting domain-containing protein [Puia sp.]|nr:T9SS type A sorting domain-containing protein [Puia sp.]
MKTTFTPYRSIVKYCASFLPFLPCLIPGPPACAQTPVTAVFTHSVNATVSTTYSGTGATGNASSGFSGNTYTYQFGPIVTTPNTSLLDSFTAVGLNFHFQATTLVIRFRRVDNTSVTGLRKSLWFEQNSNATINPGNTAKLIPAYDDSLERIFSSGQIFNIGLDNDFQNATTTNNNNIERVDFILPSGAKATDVTKAGFAVFDRGPGTGHDPFYIAAIKTLDAGGNPSAYYNAVPVVAGNYGNNVGPSLNYLIMRKNPTDADLLMMNNSTSQNRDGVLLRFSDLGVANNAVIYGYSLFAPDVVVSPASNLVNYSNATNFPTTSDLSGGGLDQVTISGLWVTNASYVVLSDKVSDFSTNLTDGKVQLRWTLNAADKLKELDIERSGDGTNFETILHFYTPPAGGQTAFDEQPLPGANFYRLKTVGQDGVTDGYSSVSTVTLPPASGSFNVNIYPNPVINRQCTLSGQGLRNEIYDLRLLDMKGTILTSWPLTGSPVFTKSLLLPENLPAGVYMIRLTDKDGHKMLLKTLVIR